MSSAKFRLRFARLITRRTSEGTAVGSARNWDRPITRELDWMIAALPMPEPSA